MELSDSDAAWLTLLLPAGGLLATASAIVYRNPDDAWNRINARLPFTATFPLRGGSPALRVVTAVALAMVGGGFLLAGLVGLADLLA